MKTLYEINYPWILWNYIRSDIKAMILGGLVVGECCICGEKKRLHLGWKGIWFPPKDSNYRHPKRDCFIAKHLHTETERINKLLWKLPLRNLAQLPTPNPDPIPNGQETPMP